jgi:hypothetical protein
VEWSNIGRKEWDESPVRSAETVLDEIIVRFQNLEWIPYWNPDSSDEPPLRKILEDPIIFQNIWPGGIRLPSNTIDAIDTLRARIGPEGANRLREQTNILWAFRKCTAPAVEVLMTLTANSSTRNVCSLFGRSKSWRSGNTKRKGVRECLGYLVSTQSVRNM